MKDTKISAIEFAENYFSRLNQCVNKLELNTLECIASTLIGTWENGHTVYVAGNGGSAATASHLVNDLAKTVLGHNRVEPGGFRSVALTDNVPLITAWANDNHYDEIFSGQLVMLAKPGDLLIVFSGSGNSKNIVRASEKAHELEMSVIALLGKNGGDMLQQADISLVVHSEEYGIIEDVHMILSHLLTNFFIQKFSNAER